MEFFFSKFKVLEVASTFDLKSYYIYYSKNTLAPHHRHHTPSKEWLNLLFKGGDQSDRGDREEQDRVSLIGDALSSLFVVNGTPKMLIFNQSKNLALQFVLFAVA